MSKKHLVGVVEKLSGEKTVKVVVTRKFRHPVYKKVVNVRRSYLVHNDSVDVKVGDEIEIVESRPMSKNKRWKLVSVVNKL